MRPNDYKCKQDIIDELKYYNDDDNSDYYR